jgi:hypothetical protein
MQVGVVGACPVNNPGQKLDTCPPTAQPGHASPPCDRVGTGVKRTQRLPPAVTVSAPRLGAWRGIIFVASDITVAVGDGSRRMTYSEPADTTCDPAILALEHAVEGLCEQLENANQRADRAEQRADLLQVKFEAGALAERIARDEAAGLRAELDARRQPGLTRRLRWALGRRG